MKEKMPIKELLLLVLILVVIWLPTFFDVYDYVIGLIITFSVIIGGYIGGRFLKK